MVRHRVRIRFSKQGNLRLIGHRDLMRCFERWFRRAGLPLARSEGFHPKPRLSFPLALALGVEGTDEVMEVELAEPRAAEAVANQLAAHAPPGLAARCVESLPPGSKKARPRSATYHARIEPFDRAALGARVERFLAAPSRRPRSPDAGPVDVRADVEAIELDDDGLSMRLTADGARRASPRDVLAALGIEPSPEAPIRLTRTTVEIEA